MKTAFSNAMRRPVVGFRWSHAILAAGAMVLASACFAQSTTTVTLTGAGDGATLGDVYVDPYTATVNGIANTTVICDDWSDNVYIGESWTVDVFNATNVGSSTPMFGNNQGLYDELAWLGSQLLAAGNNPLLQTEISFALWDLTYGVNGTYAESPAPLTYLSDVLGGTTSAEYQGALNYITLAEGESGFNASGWEILTPVAGTSVPISDGMPQEFLVYTPEASSILLLGIDMLAVALLVYLVRRRFASSN